MSPRSTTHANGGTSCARRLPATTLACIVVLALVGCSEEVVEPDPLTQLVVVLESDLEVPTRMDAIRLDVTAPSGATERATANLTGEGALALPATLGLLAVGGSLSPVTVVAEARLGGGTVVTRRVRTAFVEGASLRLTVSLVAACFGRDGSCGDEMSCGEGGACVSDDVDPATLPAFTEL